VINNALAQGWEVEWTAGSHIRFTHPSGGLVTTSGTPSDWRAPRNLESHLFHTGQYVKLAAIRKSGGKRKRKGKGRSTNAALKRRLQKG